MNLAQEKNLKTPPESDPAKINRNTPAASDTSLGAEGIEDDGPLNR